MRSITLLLSCLALTASVWAGSLLPLYRRGTVELKQEFIIPGQGDGYLMANPSVVRVGPDGSIYLLNGGQDQILHFDGQGRFVKSFSGNGSGPGEIAHCFMMEIDSQGQVCTYDFGNRRFSIFAADGRFVKNLKPQGRSLPKEYRMLSGGRLLIAWGKPDFESAESGTNISLSLYNENLETGKEVFSTKIFDNVWKRGESNQIKPFYADVFWEVQPNGTIVAAYAGDYRIEFYSLDGGLLKTVHHKTEKVPVTDQDKEELFAGMTYSRGGAISRGASPEDRKRMVFPKYKPSFDGMSVDSEGYILLRTAKKKGESVIWEVFSPAGDFVNQVTFSKVVLHMFSDLVKDRVYLARETDDEPELVCYTLH